MRADQRHAAVQLVAAALRHPLAHRGGQLGRRQVLDDPFVADPAAVTRLVFCSGKVVWDAMHERDRRGAPAAVIRLEQLYPFPQDRLLEVLERYPNAHELVWLQEEPENMGAWEFVRPLLEQIIDGRWPLRYIGRVRNSSPAEGSAAWHQVNQKAIIEQVFEERAEPKELDRVLSKQV